jgi:hypothetical protein
LTVYRRHAVLAELASESESALALESELASASALE